MFCAVLTAFSIPLCYHEEKWLGGEGMKHFALALSVLVCSLLCALPAEAVCGVRPARLFPALAVWGVCLVLCLLPLISLVCGRKK